MIKYLIDKLERVSDDCPTTSQKKNPEIHERIHGIAHIARPLHTEFPLFVGVCGDKGASLLFFSFLPPVFPVSSVCFFFSFSSRNLALQSTDLSWVSWRCVDAWEIILLPDYPLQASCNVRFSSFFSFFFSSCPVPSSPLSCLLLSAPW